MASKNVNLNGTKRALQLELKSIMEEPIEGFLIRLPNDNDILDWDVTMFGPPDTLYAGGYYKANLKFPFDYPYSAPRFRFLTKITHPNIYNNGTICISILNSPQFSENNGEHWTPIQNVRTVCLSIISMLNEPNPSSPANQEASILYKRWKEGKSKDYENLIRAQVAETKLQADKDGVVIPTTLAEYCITSPVATAELDGAHGDDYGQEFYEDDGEESDSMDQAGVEEDSGNNDE